jgi:serine-type D-Ala-D-Ala carboxypeptidase (penicillin-binding protein 5/6)
LLWEYEGTTGVKTGYTRKAGQTYVGSAARGDTEFIVVMIKGKERKQQWEEVTALFDYGFDNFQTEVLKESGDRVTADFFGEEQTFVLEEDLLATVPIDSEQKERLENKLNGRIFLSQHQGKRRYLLGRKSGNGLS